MPRTKPGKLYAEVLKEQRVAEVNYGLHSSGGFEVLKNNNYSRQKDPGRESQRSCFQFTFLEATGSFMQGTLPFSRTGVEKLLSKASSIREAYLRLRTTLLRLWACTSFNVNPTSQKQNKLAEQDSEPPFFPASPLPKMR